MAKKDQISAVPLTGLDDTKKKPGLNEINNKIKESQSQAQAPITATAVTKPNNLAYNPVNGAAGVSYSPGKFVYDPYSESAGVSQARQDMQSVIAGKPAEWNGGTYKQGLDDILNRIMNREKFSYDLNGDALYKQYKDRYIAHGQQAMQDAIGQAQAMTGGYGNSYAQTVGNQAYQGYLQGLNDKVPELYQLALDRYNLEGNELKDQYSLLNNQYQNEYEAYRNQIADWNNDVNRATDIYNNERNFDYGQYADAYNRAFGEYQQGVDDNRYAMNLAYQQQRDKISDAMNEREFQFAVDKANAANAISEQELQLARDKFNVANDQWAKEYNLNLINAQNKAEVNELKEKLKSYEDDANKTEYKDTNATNSFKSAIMTEGEFNNRGYASVGGKKYTDYQKYIEAVRRKWFENGRLSSEEVSTLAAYFGF